MPGDTLTVPTDRSRTRTRSQGSIVALLVVQREHLRSIHRTCNSAARLTDTSNSITVSTKLQTLTHLWAKCRCNHEELTEYSTDPDVSDYLRGTEFGDMEDRVLDATDALTALQSILPSTTSTRGDAANASSTSRFTSLERIPLPTFNGDQKDWAHFRDMFDSMVIHRVKFPGEPYAIHSRFGWVLRGPVDDGPVNVLSSHTTVSSLHVTFNTDLTRAIERFWEVEEIPSQNKLSAEDNHCEDLFAATTNRDASGRYHVALPFKGDLPLDIGDSHKTTLHMYSSLERRLKKDRQLAVEYNAFLTEYLRLGHMSPYTPSEVEEQRCFIPHHPVLKPSSASTKLILWRQSEKDAVVPYRLRTVTYGTAPAPFLALRVLRQLAEDEKHRFPLAAHNVIVNSYVDDIFFGASEIEECREIREQMIGLTNAGGFPLHKWSSNCPDLIYDLSETIRDPAQNVDFKEDDQLKILGIYWAPLEDAFSFRIRSEVPSTITKRTFLSYISKIYDPLGWLSPTIIISKILIQQLWLSKIDWDTTLPSDLNERCVSFCHGLTSLATVCIPRWVRTHEDSTIEIHGFADASQAAYAAVIYLRVIHEHEPNVFLLTSKSKVAPLKTVSVPRLELCAAELLSRLLAWTISALNLEQAPIYAWTDSTVTLAWLSKPPATWKVFVANRVSLIQTQCPPVNWRHVPTQDNPADLASRGVSPTQLIKNTLWWYGPSWLSCEPEAWPSVDSPESLPTSDLEARSVVTHFTKVSEWDLSTRYSDWSKLLKITALILRFVKLTRRQLPCTEILYTAQLMTEAKTFWIKVIQSSLYATELHLLRAGQRLPRSSSLLSLDPFIDDDGTIRMGGRLMHAPLTFARKHPVILSQTPLTRLIVRDAHLRTLHGGTSLTLRLLREEYWILRAKIIVSSVIGQCVICSRHRANLSSQKMAHLPEIRTNVARPFLKVGIDYAGPLPVRAFAGRGHQSRKAYIALFVCLITRAVHMELVTDLSSAAFIAAFRRFSSRRGIPAIVLSDNGTNFRGAQTELYRIFYASMCDGAVESSMASLGIEWHFIPASAPHFGGIWEAGVKSVKHHLKRIVGVHTLTIDELETLLCQVETCLNSRPIAGLSNSPDDLSYLTPGHFLTGAPLLALPDASLLDRQESRLTRYQLVQQMRDRFWQVWRLDFLNSLQKRNKWHNQCANMSVGDIVIIKNDNAPPSKWELGRITQCFPGEDGLIRVCEVRTATSTVRRPIHKLCLLPIADRDEEDHNS
ncbi:uncharacterized protein [Linepithema humile]|uniref:uncharacterized protein n=1 Tax=Linepithema humile TaxID=83485 RepID=UPI00351E260A